jgi:hypothetical protein
MTDKEERVIQSIRNACPSIEVEAEYNSRLSQWIIRGRQSGAILVLARGAVLERTRNNTFLNAFFRASQAGIIKGRH